MTAELVATDLVAGYGARPVLRGIDLRASGGEAIAIVGANGAGKTTLLRCLAGLIRPRRGRVTLNGVAIGSLSRSQAARRVAVVPQIAETMFPFTVREVVSLGRTARLGPLGTVRPQDVRAVQEAIEEMDLVTLAEARIDEVSGGERQRAVVAMALAQGTDVLLLDEPTAHLDPAHQRAALAHVRELARSRRMLVIAVLHDLNLAGAFSTRTVVIHEGRIAKDAPPREALDGSTVSAVFGDGLRVIQESGRSLVVPDPIT